MTQTSITGGSVTFERSVKVADYENKKLSVTLSFSAPEGSEADVTAVIDRTIDLVHEKLGLKKSAAASAVAQAATTGEGSPKQPAGSQSAPQPAAAPPARRTQARKPPVIDVTLTEEDKKSVGLGNISETPEDRKDPANPADVTALEEPHDDAAKVAVEGAAMTLDDFAAEALPITEADLLNACAKTAKKTGNAIAVKQVIGKFVTAPKTARDIPVELRQKFLDELAKL